MCALRAEAHTKNLYELFAGKIFRVPDYQRNYAWDENNWKDLWNDIEDGLSTQTDHYWGTITLRDTGESVYCRRKDVPLTVFEVVDGQQRIATIYLLLLAMSEMGRRALKGSFLKMDRTYTLELGGLNRQYLKDLVDGKNPPPTLRTNLLLRDALRYFHDQMEGSDSLDDVSRYLQRMTFCLEFVVQDDTLAAKAFESLNDRGKPLTVLDKTKSFLMFYSLRYLNSDLNGTIDSTFGRVFTNFDLIKENGKKEDVEYLANTFTEGDLLRFFYHFFACHAIEKYGLAQDYGYDATPDEVLKVFVKSACSELKGDPRRLGEFCRELLDSLDAFTQAFSHVLERVASEPDCKRLFSFIPINARLYPLVVGLEAEHLLDPEMVAAIETLDVRVYKVKGTDPRADLYRDTISQVKPRPNRDEILEGIMDFSRTFMDNGSFTWELGHLSSSSWSAVKYILWEWEKGLNPRFDNDNYDLYCEVQVEHILPKVPPVKFPACGFKNEVSYMQGIWNLGNLCLLEERLNKSASNSTPRVKAKYYKRSKVPRTKKMGNQLDSRRFDAARVEELGEEITSFCLQRWSV